MARRVELRTRVGRSRVQGDDLVAHDVGTGFEAGGNGIGVAVSGGHERSLKG